MKASLQPKPMYCSREYYYPSRPCSLPSAMECPSETATCPSIAAKLQELLSQVMLDTSSPASVDTSPRRPTSAALGTPMTIRVEDLQGPERPVLAMPKLVATSQQVSLWVATPDDAIPISHYCLWPWCQKLPRQPVSLLPHNPRLILGQPKAPFLTKYSN